MRLNLWLNKLERKISKIAIEKLMTLLTVAMGLVLITDLFLSLSGYEISIYGMLSFNRDLIFSGQVWRVISFLFLYPASSNIFLTLISLYFYWWLGNLLESYWGKARFNLYYLFGVIGSIIAGFIAGGMTNVYLNLSLFLAFAMLFPNTEVLLFFFIPIKVKWLGIVDGILLFISFIIGNWISRAAIIAAIINFLIFFGYQLFYNIKKAIENFRNRPKM